MKELQCTHAHCRCMNLDGQCPNPHYANCLKAFNKLTATPETELNYCTTCIQMTNHRRASCLKCGIKEPYINVEYLLREIEDKELFEAKIRHLIAIRDTYWNEQVQKAREEVVEFLKENGEEAVKDLWYVHRAHFEKALHSELDQDITSTTKEG